MGIIISLPISLILLWLVLRPKKNDPFPKRGMLRLIFSGAVCTIVASVIGLLLSLLLVVIRIGPDTLMQIITLMQTDPSGIPALLESIGSNHAVSPLRVLFTTLITAGLLEEVCKYAASHFAIRKKDMIRTWMDSAIWFRSISAAALLWAGILGKPLSSV